MESPMELSTVTLRKTFFDQLSFAKLHPLLLKMRFPDCFLEINPHEGRVPTCEVIKKI